MFRGPFPPEKFQIGRGNGKPPRAIAPHRLTRLGLASSVATICDRLTVEEIAVRHGFSRDTIRAQVKALLAKTGTRRQVEAVSLLRGLPRFPFVEK